MGTKENKALIQRLFTEGFPNAPDGLTPFFSPKYVDHSFFDDLAGLKAASTSFRKAYPNLEWKIDQMVAEGDIVAVRSRMFIRNAYGTHKELGSTSMYRIVNGKIVETWGHGDPLLDS